VMKAVVLASVPYTVSFMLCGHLELAGQTLGPD